MTDKERDKVLEERIAELERNIGELTPEKNRQLDACAEPRAEPLAPTKLEEWERVVERLKSLRVRNEDL